MERQNVTENTDSGKEELCLMIFRRYVKEEDVARKDFHGRHLSAICLSYHK